MLMRALRYAVFCLALAPVARAGQANFAVMPAVHTSALNGDVVDLPASLKGKAAVLVVGFSQGSRDDVIAWGRRLAADFHDSPNVRYYEVSVLAGVPRFLRGYVLRKISADVPDRAKPHFFAVDDHEPEWRAVTRYRKADDAYVLVIDGGGQVRWTVEGPATDASYQQMMQRLQAMRSGQ